MAMGPAVLMENTVVPWDTAAIAMIHANKRVLSVPVRRMHVHWIIHAVCLTQETMDAVLFLMLSAVRMINVVHLETLVTQTERAATRKSTHHLENNMPKRALDL